MSETYGSPDSRLLAQQYYTPSEKRIFPNSMKVGLAVAAAVAITFAVLAGMHYLMPYSAIVAGGLGGAEILFIAIWYCVQKPDSQKRPPAPLFNPSLYSARMPTGSGHGTLPPPHSSSRNGRSSDRTSGHLPPPPLQEIRIPDNPHDVEAWGLILGQSQPSRANLVDGSDRIGENTNAGFHPVPYIGNYDNGYMGLAAPFIQWRLPPSQLAGFPEEMQHHFAWYAHHDLLDVFFIGARDPGGRYLARNIIMHSLALPEYDSCAPRPARLPQGVYRTSGGLGTNVQVRIFEPHGIESFKDYNYYDAAPFDGDGVAQSVIYHPGHGRSAVDISPNNARFVIQRDADYCSFYVGATYRGRACAFYVIITRTEFDALSTALERSQNLHDFPINLDEFPYQDNIAALLRHY